MSIIKVENLTFTYNSSYDNIFENVSFVIDTDWKLGFVGRNGRGKTTFLNLLLGKYEYNGKIISSVQFDYFPYSVENKSRLTEEILFEVCPLAEEWELMRELSYLDVEPDVLWRSFDTLSNGEQTKVLLAALFLNEGHFLLIDEPTNHLDVKARKSVADYLKRKKGFILVSHDRNVLDTCVDHILALNRTNIEVQKGNFSSWMKNFELQQKFEIRQNERLKRDIKHLEVSAKRSAVWSDRVEASKIGAADKGFVGHKAAKMMKRSKSVEARQKDAIKQKSLLLKNTENAEDLKISPLEHHAEVLARFMDVSPVYNGITVCAPVSFEIKQGERVVLDGKNGSGKSSILKLLTDKSMEYNGKVSIASGLIISYVPQDTSHLHGTLSEYAQEYSIDESIFKSLLRKMDFERVQFEKDISDFSGGQKKKVLIARSLCEKAHLYIWDEPLNFIDIYSRRQIENLIIEYEPTMLLVEHDKAFRDAVGTKIIEL
jgi:ABC superfamily ATP binding cassette transporter